MAIHNDPRMYSGGSVVFNSQPEINLYANLMAKKQAKQDAMDQYYQNLHKSINPAGMRTADINGGFTKKIDDTQKFYFQNRDAIRKQQTPEQRALASQYESMHQDLLMDINKSKEAAAHELEIAKANMAGKLNPTDEDLKVSHGISAPIYSREHYKDDAMTQPYTINDLSLNVPQFDPKQQEEFYKASTQGLTAGKAYNEKDLRRDRTTGQVFIPFEQSYSDDQLKTIGDRAGNIVEGSRSAKVHYEHLMHDPNFLIPANQAYQSVYGSKDFVDTPKKAAIAATLMSAKAERNHGEELKKDETLDFQRQIFMEGLKQKDRLALLDAKEKAKAMGAAANDVWIDNYIDKLKQDSGEMREYKTSDGKSVYGKKISIDPVLSKAVGFDDKNKGEVIVTNDGRFIIAHYKTDQTFEPIKKDGAYQIDKERTNTISQDQMKLALGAKSVSPTQRTKEMVSNQSTAKPVANEGYTEQELLNSGKGWTKERIREAVKSGKIKLRK